MFHDNVRLISFVLPLPLTLEKECKLLVPGMILLMEEILHHPGMYKKLWKNYGISTTVPSTGFSGILNHQQYSSYKLPIPQPKKTGVKFVPGPMFHQPTASPANDHETGLSDISSNDHGFVLRHWRLIHLTSEHGGDFSGCRNEIRKII